MAKTHTIETGDILTDGYSFRKVLKATDKMVTFQHVDTELIASPLNDPRFVPGDIRLNKSPEKAKASGKYVGTRWEKWNGVAIRAYMD